MRTQPVFSTLLAPAWPSKEGDTQETFNQCHLGFQRSEPEYHHVGLLSNSNAGR